MCGCYQRTVAPAGWLRALQFLFSASGCISATCYYIIITYVIIHNAHGSSPAESGAHKPDSTRMKSPAQAKTCVNSCLEGNS